MLRSHPERRGGRLTIYREIGLVGSWWFFDSASLDDVRARARAAEMFATATAILVEHGLFVPRRLEGPGGGVDVQDPSDIRQRAPELEGDFLELHGDGTVVDVAGRPITEAGSMWLLAEIGGGAAIAVITQSDVWMPYSLRGEAQEAVQARNAPRLEAALRALEEALGTESDPDEDHRLAISTRYGVTNHVEDEGRPWVPPQVEGIPPA